VFLAIAYPFASFRIIAGPRRVVELGLEVAPTLGRKVEHVPNLVEQIVVALVANR
jgi:hypothetical protein